MRRRPRQKRPSSSRRTRPCASSATASRWAVGRLSPVTPTSSASERGSRLDGGQHGHRLVEHADAAYTVHSSRSSSQNVRQSRGNAMAKTLSREGVGPPPGAERTGRARPALHRSPPRPRGHQPAGLRRHPAGRPRGSGGPTSPSPPPTTTCPTEDIDQPVEDPISAKQLEVLAANTAEFGITHYGMGDPNQGIVHVIGPEQGRTLPGHDDRVRRQPHLHPRRLRRAGLRHRHQRGRARARHPDAPPAAPRHDGRHRHRRAARPAPPPRT